MSDCLQLHCLWHARLLCLPLSPGACPNSCPLTLWCYLTISSCVSPFSFCRQSFPASGSFPVSWLFPSGGQSIGDSASASVLPMNIRSWLPVGLTGLISLESKSLLQHHNSTASVLHRSAFFRASLIAQLVKNPLAMQETLVEFLGWEDLLEKG